MGHSWPLFIYFRLFNTVDSEQMFNINIADNWIWTTDFWYRKRPLYQRSQNDCSWISCTLKPYFTDPRYFYKWPLPGLFDFIFVFTIDNTKWMGSLKIADKWIRTQVLWCQKRGSEKEVGTSLPSIPNTWVDEQCQKTNPSSLTFWHLALRKKA